MKWLGIGVSILVLSVCFTMDAEAYCDVCDIGFCCFLPRCEQSPYWCYEDSGNNGMDPCILVGQSCPYDGCGGWTCSSLSGETDGEAPPAAAALMAVRVHSFAIQVQSPQKELHRVHVELACEVAPQEDRAHEQVSAR